MYIIKDLAKKIGISFLAILILFLSSGIHQLTCHTSAACLNSAKTAERTVFSCASPDHPGSERCNACFFSHLLNQCLFPVFEQPALAESFNPRIRPSLKAAAFIAPGNKGNRGPPSGAARF